jgi:protease-4
VTRRLTVVAVTLGLWAGVLALFLVVVAGALQGPDGGPVAFGPRVAVVELEGLILEVDDLLKDLRSYRDTAAVRAVVVRINSPGGVVAPTQEIHDALQRIRQAGKPVVASLGAVAASGGYYVAVAADRIYANPGTLTGSIGVLMQMANLESLMKKVGVDYVVIKAGHFKDLGNVSRPMTTEERRVLQALLDDVHGQFIQAVAAGRHLDRAVVQRFADGRVFSGTQAKALGMLDELGSLEEAINAAARMAGLPVPPRVVPPRRRLSVFDLLRSAFGPGLRGVIAPAAPVFKAPLYLMD